jgi:glycosyltransferase involved in cell wall biosynthesis
MTDDPTALSVLLVSDFIPPVRGGLELHVANLARELVRLGLRVHVATLTAEPELDAPGVIVHPLRSLVRHLPHSSADRPFHPPLPDPLARRELATLIARVAPDVVHAHSWLGVSLPRPRPPLVFTAHDYGLACALRTLYTGGATCAGPSAVRCLACVAHEHGPLRSALLVPGTATGRRLVRPERLIAVSAAVATALREVGLGPVDVIPNFVAPAPAPVRATALDGIADGFVLFAGDPGEHKGLADLLAIWGGPTPPPAPLVLALTRPVELALPPGVLATSLSRAELAGAWPRAALAVVPSRWPDPCPTTALEALLAGVPVVATATGGLPHILRDGVDGVLVAPDDRTALASAIRGLLADPERRARQGEAGRVGVERFAASSVVPRLVATYRHALGERPVPTEGAHR